MTPVRITAVLAGPLADYAPALDGLLLEAQSRRLGTSPDRLPSRWKPAPDPLDVPHIHLDRDTLGDWPVYRVSRPILAECPAHVAHFGKRIGVERSRLLRPDERRVVVTSNTWTKSYRLPVRVLTVPSVVWFAVGDPDGLRDLLGGVQQLGRKLSHGWGRVKEWHVEEATADWSWYAPDQDSGRPVLMRVLPLCPELPADLDGWRADFGACCPPYWHRDRYVEVVAPC